MWLPESADCRPLRTQRQPLPADQPAGGRPSACVLVRSADAGVEQGRKNVRVHQVAHDAQAEQDRQCAERAGRGAACLSARCFATSAKTGQRADLKLRARILRVF
jgi:hypothetical protein